MSATENKMDLQTIESRQTEDSSTYNDDKIAPKHVQRLDDIHEVFTLKLPSQAQLR